MVLAQGERWILAKNSSTAEKQDFDRNLHGSLLHLGYLILISCGDGRVPGCLQAAQDLEGDAF